MAEQYIRVQCQAAQPEEHQCGLASRQANSDYWAIGFGKVVFGFRHHYAEGQRRYVESLAYARQFLGQMDKPDVDSIDGLSRPFPLTKNTTHNPRSTVGTVTESMIICGCCCCIRQPHCPIVAAASEPNSGSNGGPVAGTAGRNRC